MLLLFDGFLQMAQEGGEDFARFRGEFGEPLFRDSLFGLRGLVNPVHGGRFSALQTASC